MRIYVNKANITAGGMPRLGDRSYLQLDVEMSAEQKRDAIYALLCSMPEQESYEWLRSEFPEWFKEVA